MNNMGKPRDLMPDGARRLRTAAWLVGLVRRSRSIQAFVTVVGRRAALTPLDIKPDDRASFAQCWCLSNGRF
jgi:hypothetical protein